MQIGWVMGNGKRGRGEREDEGWEVGIGKENTHSRSRSGGRQLRHEITKVVGLPPLLETIIPQATTHHRQR